MKYFFKKQIERLKKLESVKENSFTIAADEHGNVEKECPNNKCLFSFKVFEEDWRNIFRDNEVFCPRCGESDIDENFWTSDQVRTSEKRAEALIEDILNGRRIPLSHLPIEASKPFELQGKCDECKANYAVQGSGFYCPKLREQLN